MACAADKFEDTFHPDENIEEREREVGWGRGEREIEREGEGERTKEKGERHHVEKRCKFRK